MRKIRDWLGTALIALGMRVGGAQFAQLIVLVLVTRLMHSQNMAAIELVGNGVMIHKYPEGTDDEQEVTLH